MSVPTPASAPGAPAAPDFSHVVETANDTAQYRISVENLMISGSSLAVSNSLPAHAAILFEEFFKHAKKRVRILTWKLAVAVFGDPDLCREAEDALKRGVRITVITQMAPEASPFLSLLRKFKERVEFIEAQINSSPFAQSVCGWDLNFAVMDERAYRVEPDRALGKAQAVMNNPSYAAGLNEFFKRVVAGLQAQPSSAEVPA